MDLLTHSDSETKAAGREFFQEHLAAAFESSGTQGASVVALVGDLGAGKTHFVKGLVEGAGYEGDVTSPTFSLVREYQGAVAEICHFDFYRIEHEVELWELGWEDYLDRSSVLAVEWADRFPDAIPDGAIWVDLEHVAEPFGTRRIRSREQVGEGAS